MGARIVLSTFGTLGDLHPVMAIACELRARGHQAIIATSELYRRKVEEEGLGFHAIRPDLPTFDKAPELIRRLMDLRSGTWYLFHKLLMPALRDTYQDLHDIARGADLLVSYPTVPAAPLVAERLRMKWVSVVPWPLSLWSAHDMSYTPGMYMGEAHHQISPTVLRFSKRILMRFTRRWVKEVDRFRAELGLAPGAHPMLEGQYSPYGVLALFSSVIAKAQPDWPQPTTICGYCFYDKKGTLAGLSSQGDSDGLAPELRAFLEDGVPPVVFTLGSGAVFNAGEFYEQSVQAAQLLECRALLLIGDERNRPRSLPRNTPQIAAFDYAPFGALFPHADAVVHQGGSGTTGQTLRAGVPSLVVPYSFDQPDHAMRLQRLGVGRYLARRKYAARRVARILGELLLDEKYAKHARELATKVRAENGPRAAAEAMEAVLSA
jgi:UDP:flavonoid glycosyltransferase YjiC (YdhE family)